ncbi:hypothetical protein ABZY81_39455 [Streptomyces sp. NPDC006514]|uniref:hypothetical protein n=1 Tax=Streptomyces sp. NPDC006514 TaxID=3154308 RepID=UPI0033AE67F9
MTERSPVARADELIDAWQEMSEHVDDDPQTYERLVIECAHELAADRSGPLACRWTLGLVLALPYLATRNPRDDDFEAAFEAAQAADRAQRDAPCTHQGHPFQDNLEGELGNMADVIRDLADDGRCWTDSRPRDAWLCPRNVAGYARVVMESLRPGSAGDVPPFLPFRDRYDLETLTAIMEGYPLSRTYDVAWDLSFAASALQAAADDELAGRVFVAAAVVWYVESEGDDSDARQLVDELAAAFERAIGLLHDDACPHGTHPDLPSDTTQALWVGMHMASARGRAAYEKWPEPWAPPLHTALCSAFVAATARDSLTRLRTS